MGDVSCISVRWKSVEARNSSADLYACVSHCLILVVRRRIKMEGLYRVRIGTAYKDSLCGTRESEVAMSLKVLVLLASIPFWSSLIRLESWKCMV